eukprot:4940618-Amphidinium_carterae.2
MATVWSRHEIIASHPSSVHAAKSESHEMLPPLRLYLRWKDCQASFSGIGRIGSELTCKILGWGSGRRSLLRDSSRSVGHECAP